MIGFFVFEEVPSVESPMVLAHSALNENIKGFFYTRSNDCKDVSSVQNGARFFGILDDSSGFGACLFIEGLDVETDNMLLKHNIHVNGNSVVDGDSEIKGNTTINGDLNVYKNASISGKLDVVGNITTPANISGNAFNSTITITAAHAASILAAGTSGVPPLVPLAGVQIILQ